MKKAASPKGAYRTLVHIDADGTCYQPGDYVDSLPTAEIASLLDAGRIEHVEVA